uniref:fimbrial protein n=1 Tax=Porphyromonas loveana TaxID=1884669 RepID=UPI0035A095FC
MKKTKFFLLGLAALSLAACNKDNGVEPIVETDATVSFVIKTGEGRAVGDGLEDAKITKLTAMVYSGQVQEALKTVEDATNGVTKV